MKPGDIVHPDGAIEVGAAGPTVELEVVSTSDRAIQVTSHYHFFEANRRLRFDRAAAFGMRLDVPAGTGVRFEPGETRTVRLRPYGGLQIVRGFNGLVDGRVADPAVREAALRRAHERGFLDAGEGRG